MTKTWYSYNRKWLVFISNIFNSYTLFSVDIYVAKKQANKLWIYMDAASIFKDCMVSKQWERPAASYIGISELISYN